MKTNPKIYPYFAYIMLGFFIPVGFVRAVVLDGHILTEKEILIENAADNIALFLMILAVPLFVAGVIKQLRSTDKVKKTNFVWVFTIFSFCFTFLFFAVAYLGNLFYKAVDYLYPDVYIALIIPLMLAFFLGKISVRIFDINFSFVSSLILTR